MSIRSFIAQEELEVEKLLDKELQTDKSDEFDDLYEDIKQKQELKDNQDSEETGTVDDTETVNADEEMIDDDTTAAIEALKELDYQIATEDWSSVGLAASKAIGTTTDVIGHLAKLGIHYTPIALSKVYKGVSYAIGRLVSGLITSFIAINKQRIRVHETFDKSKENIDSLRKALDVIQTPSDLTEVTFSNQKVINSLKISDSVDIIANLTVLDSFLNSSIKSISASIDSDIAYSKQLIAYATSNTVKSPNDLMVNITMVKHLSDRSVPGFEEKSSLLATYSYEHTLPGDIEFIAQLPVSDIDNIDDIAKAYNAASMFLGFNNQTFKQIDAIDYLDKQGVTQLLDAIDKVCTSALQHVEFYNHIENQKKSLKYNFRLYIASLVNSSKRLSVGESLIDYINLKSLFIDKVYLSSAIDIHDYTIRIVGSALRFAKDNVSKLA